MEKTITMQHKVYGLLEFDHVHTRTDGKGICLMRNAIPFREFDSAGENDWLGSDVRRWLNSSKPAGYWHDAERDTVPRYWDSDGFLAGFKEEDLSLISAENGVLFFLPSYTEITGRPNGSLGMEGEQWDAFKNGSRKLLKKRELMTGDTAWWWLRSPDPDNSNYVRSVDAGGITDTYIDARYRLSALVPACVIS